MTNKGTIMTNFEDKISLLIPAFLRGELSESERREVEEHASKNPEIAAEIEFQRNLKVAIQPDQASFEPGELGWAKLSKAIDAADVTSPATISAPKQQYWKYAAAILAVLAIGQAGVLGTIATKPKQDAQYLYASEASDNINIIKLGFSPNVSENTITKLLQKHEASIIAGPSSLGLYDVKFKSDHACKEAMDVFKTTPTIIDTLTPCR